MKQNSRALFILKRQQNAEDHVGGTGIHSENNGEHLLKVD